MTRIAWRTAARRAAGTSRIGVVLAICAAAQAQVSVDPGDALAAINSTTRLQLFPVSGNVYLLADPDGATNVTVQIGDEGILVVDSGTQKNAEEAVTLIRRLSSGTIRYLINTTGLEDYTGGNEVLAGAGSGYPGSGYSGTARANGIAHENAMLAMVKEGRLTAGGYPDLSFYGEHQPIYFNSETVDIIHYPNASTDGDSIVFFRRSDVISTGPIFLTTTYPLVYPERGGSIEGLLDALNAIIEITNTRKNQEGGTLVISGAGRVADESDVVEYRDMLTIIRERIRHYMEQGMSLAEIKAAGPTLDYDGRYAAESGPAEPAAFVELIFNELRANGGRQ